MCLPHGTLEQFHCTLKTRALRGTCGGAELTPFYLLVKKHGDYEAFDYCKDLAPSQCSAMELEPQPVRTSLLSSLHSTLSELGGGWQPVMPVPQCHGHQVAHKLYLLSEATDSFKQWVNSLESLNIK